MQPARNNRAFQHRVGRFSSVIGDLIMSARQKFADNITRKDLLNAIHLRLVHKDRHSDGTDAGRDARRVSGGVIAAARRGQDRQQQYGERELH